MVTEPPNNMELQNRSKTNQTTSPVFVRVFLANRLTTRCLEGQILVDARMRQLGETPHVHERGGLTQFIAQNVFHLLLVFLFGYFWIFIVPCFFIFILFQYKTKRE